MGALRGTVAKLETHRAVERAGRRTAADGGAAVAADEVLAAKKATCFAARLPAARRPGALTRVLEVFRRHGVPVLAATVTSNAGEAAVTVTTGAVAPSAVCWNRPMIHSDSSLSHAQTEEEDDEYSAHTTMATNAPAARTACMLASIPS